MIAHYKPSKEEVAAAYGKAISDVVSNGLTVLFCGINPSLYSGATGNHFARPGNRFWRALHAAGFTDRVLHPSEKDALLARGLGVTNLVTRSTATAAELSNEELIEGGRSLERKARRLRPEWLAFLGVTSYRVAFGRPDAVVGEQRDNIGGTRVWVLPNPSGLNAHYQLPDLTREFAKLREAAGL